MEHVDLIDQTMAAKYPHIGDCVHSPTEGHSLDNPMERSHMRAIQTALGVSLALVLGACMVTNPRYRNIAPMPQRVDQTEAIRVASLVLVNHGYTPSVVNENVGMITTDWRTTGGWQKVLFGHSSRNRISVVITDTTLTVTGDNQTRQGDSLIGAILDSDDDDGTIFSDTGDTGWFGSDPSSELRVEWQQIQREIIQSLASMEPADQVVTRSRASGTSQTIRSSHSVRTTSGNGERIPIAVLDFKGLGLDKEETLILSDRLRAELVDIGVFQVIERARVQEILEEQGFQQETLCSTEDCAVEMGRMIGVRHIVAGSIGRLGNTFTTTVRLIDVESGEIVMRASDDCQCELDQLLEGMARIAMALAEGVN